MSKDKSTINNAIPLSVICLYCKQKTGEVTFSDNLNFLNEPFDFVVNDILPCCTCMQRLIDQKKMLIVEVIGDYKDTKIKDVPPSALGQYMELPVLDITKGVFKLTSSETFEELKERVLTRFNKIVVEDIKY